MVEKDFSRRGQLTRKGTAATVMTIAARIAPIDPERNVVVVQRTDPAKITNHYTNSEPNKPKIAKNIETNAAKTSRSSAPFKAKGKVMSRARIASQIRLTGPATNTSQ